MINILKNEKYLFLFAANLFFICLLVPSFLIQSSYSEIFSKNITVKCKFEYNIQSTKFPCYQENIEQSDECIPFPFASNTSTVKTPLLPSVNFDYLNSTKIWKSKVHPLLMPQAKFDNVGEPSIASNGTYVFYTGNHYAAKSNIGQNWDYVDPSFDFNGNLNPINTTSGNTSSGGNATEINLFEADQRTVYDHYHNMYIWIRLGKSYNDGHITNIVRLAISNDTVHWTVYDFIPKYIFTDPDIIDARFDYPEAIVSTDYLYLTSSLVVGENCEKEYGTILRVPLDNLSNSLNNINSSIPYSVVLDRNVTAITPVDAAPNRTTYFGAHLQNNSSMKIYEWKEDSNSFTNQTVHISPWNDIHNSEICGSNPTNSDLWWCKANTSSRIRSAWLHNNTLNFLWNSVTTYDDGKTWTPYIDVATFNLTNNMGYERKYYVAENCRPWIFGAAMPNAKDELGIVAYYVTGNYGDENINPYLNLAFGLFNHTTNKWNMMSLINSSSSLPVKNEEMKDDYNFGDFITIRKHPQPGGDYSWDAGAYVIVGKEYDDIDPYFIMIK